MSGNLDLVKRIYARWAEGDFSDSDWASPDVELVIKGGVSPGTWRGLEGMVEGWREMLNAWDDLRVVVDEIRELDDERILLLIRNTARGKVSGLEVADIHPKSANLVELRDGKVIRITAWWDRQQALDELGV